MVQWFADKENDKPFESDWVSIEPVLPNARLISQSALSTDIVVSPDGALRWSFDTEVNPQGSAVRAIVRRWCETRPMGLVIRVVLDDVEAQMKSLTAKIEYLRVDNEKLRTEADQAVDRHFDQNNLQEIKCDLHRMSIGNGQAERQLEGKWKEVRGLVGHFKRDHKFRVMFGAGNHEPNELPPSPNQLQPPSPMQQFVFEWMRKNKLRCSLGYAPNDGPLVEVFHVVHYRRRNTYPALV